MRAERNSNLNITSRVPSRPDPDDKRQARFLGREVVIRVKILEPLRGTHFAVGLDGLHDPLANHRNTPIIPASMLGAVAEAPTRFSGWCSPGSPTTPATACGRAFLLSFLEALL